MEQIREAFFNFLDREDESYTEVPHNLSRVSTGNPGLRKKCSNSRSANQKGHSSNRAIPSIFPDNNLECADRIVYDSNIDRKSDSVPSDFSANMSSVNYLIKYPSVMDSVLEDACWVEIEHENELPTTFVEPTLHSTEVTTPAYSINEWSYPLNEEALYDDYTAHNHESTNFGFAHIGEPSLLSEYEATGQHDYSSKINNGGDCNTCEDADSLIVSEGNNTQIGDQNAFAVSKDTNCTNCSIKTLEIQRMEERIVEMQRIIDEQKWLIEELRDLQRTSISDGGN